MALDVAAIQQALRSSGLDGWLLYDFHGSNPIAGRLTGVAGGPHMTTRRWYYLIPANAPPRGLVHAIERHNLDHLPGAIDVYAGRVQLDDALDRLLEGVGRVAMEYSPLCAIPYLSRVDAGTAEAVRARGVEILSSGDLVQQFEARWTPAQLASHQAAADSLYRIKDRAFAEAADALRSGRTLTEYDLQQLMSGWFDAEGLVSDSAPVVAVGANAGNPHYLPTQRTAKPIVKDEVLLLDLWGKQQPQGAGSAATQGAGLASAQGAGLTSAHGAVLASAQGAVFADITWVGVTSAKASGEVEAAFRAVIGARDAAVALVDEAARGGRELRGWEVDRAARTVLDREGYSAHVLHRTGHSLGESVHGNGVHLDDYETHDDRRILPGTGFTVEPGVYFETFGIRSEINVYRGEHAALVTGPRQTELVKLL